MNIPGAKILKSKKFAENIIKSINKIENKT